MVMKCWLTATLLSLMLIPAIGTADSTSCPCTEDGHQRAGNPQQISCLAIPTNNCSFVGYFVGGGSFLPHFSHGPCVGEGTWGWDYSGFVFHRRIQLGWWNKPHYQGGMGGYKTDGPRLEPPEGCPEGCRK